MGILRILATVLLLSTAVHSDVSSTRMGRPLTWTGKSVHGLAWTVKMEEWFSTSDAIEIDCRLQNAGDEKITFDTQPGLQGPLLILRKEGSVVSTCPLVHRQEVPQSGNRFPEPNGGVAHGFMMDARLYFGRLKPGRYSFQVTYRKEHYQIPGKTSEDIPSPIVPFRVWKTDVATAQAYNPNIPGVTFIAGATTARLRNDTNRIIEFPAYVNKADPNLPLVAAMEWQHWVPGQGWVSPGHSYYCKSGREMYRLEPGKEVTLQIRTIPKDGIYRYVLHSADYKTAIWSNAVCVDRLSEIERRR
jgi:hypothetical protein